MGGVIEIYNIRQVMPNLGCRKLHYLLRKALLKSGHSSLGRDKLFQLLREKNMLILRKRKYAITTDSNHQFKVYKNLILDKAITRKNQVWVSDITYVKTKKGFSYISLITDAFIFFFSNNLEAFRDWFTEAPEQNIVTSSPSLNFIASPSLKL